MKVKSDSAVPIAAAVKKKRTHRQPGIKADMKVLGRGYLVISSQGKSMTSLTYFISYMPTFTSSHTKLTRSPGESVSSSQMMQDVFGETVSR
ncbi:hypothetical protein CEXT_496931 [Caerostris extrusa]|uniref:Uncharacterized protein n=1 Tax=Caerostris extrusa TaxID=172846 RepID=A0AAV4Y3I8_CAEEX|nr:hypothetical protein CEXT_496931 [Caerostris extrusa]